jgi:hypothetical protein
MRWRARPFDPMLRPSRVVRQFALAPPQRTSGPEEPFLLAVFACGVPCRSVKAECGCEFQKRAAPVRHRPKADRTPAQPTPHKPAEVGLWRLLDFDCALRGVTNLGLLSSAFGRWGNVVRAGK